MSKTIDRYYLQIQALTPIHIGSGEEVMPYEYIIDDQGKYYRIDLFELLNILPPEKRKELVDVMEKDLVKLRASIAEYNWKSSVVYQGKASNIFISEYRKHIKRIDNNLAVQELINSKMRPYIPGSSLKGAFRTAYLHKYGKNINYNISRNRKGFFTVRNNKRIAQEIEKRSLNYSNFFEDPFQTVKISDSSLNIDNIEIHKIISLNVSKDNSSGIPYYQETISGLISSNVEENIDVELSIDLARQNYNYQKNSVTHSITAEDLLKATKYFSKKMIEKELSYLKSKKVPNDTIKVYQHLKSIHSDLKENESLIRFGKGIGFNSTTLNLSNKTTTVNPVSRVLADGRYPMGWALFSLNKERQNKSILNNKAIKMKSEEMEKKNQEKIEEKKSKYPNLMAYIKDKHGDNIARKVAINKTRGKNELYKQYKREYEIFLKS